MINMTVIRAGSEADLEEVDVIQRVCPEAAQWKVRDYLEQDFRVAIVGNRVAGFIVLRSVAPDERELLNLAVAPGNRRKGVAEALINAALEGFAGTVYLEVRESNGNAIKFYNRHNFQEVSRRAKYYQNPAESAIVMKFHSC
ncbi:MAG: GCN5-related N-acetyltransferase [Candidatus Solibacter sp.]|jgi:ribosomal-protein-alanine N-acetyltransferase|nr:GCN5-related N-acetyltransferase [Candidatus Solibacter sp.]